MSQSHTARIRITEEELVALLGPIPIQVVPATPAERTWLAGTGVDCWFKYRMLFLLGVAAMYTSKLLFFPVMVAANFDLGGSAFSIDDYSLLRAGFVVLISAVYFYSYLKDWHFERVSLVFLGVGVMALMLDYFNTYVHISQAPTQWIAGLIALRFLVVFCLLMNAMGARHAPPIPRRLWS